MIGTLLNVPLLPLIFFFLQPVRGRGPPPYTPCWKPEIRLTNRPTYLSQPEVVLRVSKRAEMNGTARGKAAIGFNCFKRITFFSIFSKRENNFDVPGAYCASPVRRRDPKPFSTHRRVISPRAPYCGGHPRARKDKASIGKNRMSAVIYLPTSLVGS